MDYTITNGILTAHVSSRGAELKSLALGGVEYVWPGGNEWVWSAPVCCPWCGMLDEFEYGGQKYGGTRHGFVREAEHDLLGSSDASLTFGFDVPSDDERWPWPFALTAEYTLDGAALTLAYVITNTGSEKMPLQFGFHPGFVAPEGSIIHSEKPDMPGGKDAMPIVPGSFDSGSIDIAAPVSAWFRLERGDGHSLTVDTSKASYVLLWGSQGATPFACIEPWLGYPSDGSPFDRPGVSVLAPGEKLSFALNLKLA